MPPKEDTIGVCSNNYKSFDQEPVALGKFRCDDRVVVYGSSLTGTPIRSTGTIVNVLENRLHVRVDRESILQVEVQYLFAHPKQCRRLKKKSPPRTLWVKVYEPDRPATHSQGSDVNFNWDINSAHVATKSPLSGGNWVEFREVKK